MESLETKFCFSDYDSIGFDLDNTIVKYNITNMIKTEYEVLSEFLVAKGYSKEFLMKPFEDGFNFLQKGLILDFEKGNLLRICPDGGIQIASHGTKLMSREEIIKIYGEKKRWEVTDEYCKDMLVAWNGTLADLIRTCLDYFDMPAALAFARIVDSIDFQNNGQPQSKYQIWPDVLAGLLSMYNRDLFANNKSKYFEAMKKNPSDYIYRCEQNVIDWLKKLKENKTTFLLTGSHIDFATFTAEFALGPNWRDYFDFIICFAKKPGFFTMDRPFYQLDGISETGIIDIENMIPGNVYTQGNFKDLKKIIGKNTKTENPKIVYIGDNLIQDVFTPSKHMKIDTIAIVDEMQAEGVDYNPEYEILRSNFWGSYFHTNGDDTLWERIIRTHSKICIPSLDAIVSHPIDYKFRCFNPENPSSCGYYPHDPFDPYTNPK
ncbi:CLUMA_CG011908, isoform A [Clunio marinus]|uniref:5'-nucleotidase domain-containing protein 1 n=1 Tax=Clunio marinus TaxID=568069 RepID=A0A1J1IE56_9DIPT|nr:CLUMA_CG011908, isoform A [Clunio marinus]